MRVGARLRQRPCAYAPICTIYVRTGPRIGAFHGDDQQVRCRMLHPGSRCGYVFGLVLSVIVFVLPSFFLKEGSTFRK